MQEAQGELAQAWDPSKGEHVGSPQQQEASNPNLGGAAAPKGSHRDWRHFNDQGTGHKWADCPGIRL